MLAIYFALRGFFSSTAAATSGRLCRAPRRFVESALGTQASGLWGVTGDGLTQAWRVDTELLRPKKGIKAGKHEKSSHDHTDNCLVGGPLGSDAGDGLGRFAAERLRWPGPGQPGDPRFLAARRGRGIQRRRRPWRREWLGRGRRASARGRRNGYGRPIDARQPQERGPQGQAGKLGRQWFGRRASGYGPGRSGTRRRSPAVPRLLSRHGIAGKWFGNARTFRREHHLCAPGASGADCYGHTHPANGSNSRASRHGQLKGCHAGPE
jgi:hypothetical protein